ncbi:MAG: single-stranded DNA-binding protein [Candidatus Marinimicrobia bacterium]|nr:single-stranded DNA-binding protein [Candidatus Neomarinimicrobiota bacterium]
MQRNSVNKVILVGHVGADPEPRYTPSGTAVVNLRMATNESWRDADGNDQERTEWHRVVLWGKQAEFAANYIKKGQLISVEGSLQTRTWEDRNKVEQRTTEIRAQAITTLGGRKDSDAKPPEDAPGVSESPPDDDDIPF